MSALGLPAHHWRRPSRSGRETVRNDPTAAGECNKAHSDAARPLPHVRAYFGGSARCRVSGFQHYIFK